MNTTIVIGANTNPERYGCKAVLSLIRHGFPVIAYGQEKGKIEGVQIENEWNPGWKVETVTLYINPFVQKDYYAKIVALKPKRVIFNPGTENSEFIEMLEKNEIHAELSCTLVLLSTGQYSR